MYSTTQVTNKKIDICDSDTSWKSEDINKMEVKKRAYIKTHKQ